MNNIWVLNEIGLNETVKIILAGKSMTPHLLRYSIITWHMDTHIIEQVNEYYKQKEK